MRNLTKNEQNFSSSGRLLVNDSVTNLTLMNLVPLMLFKVNVVTYAKYKKNPWGYVYEESDLNKSVVTFETRKWNFVLTCKLLANI